MIILMKSFFLSHLLGLVVEVAGAVKLQDSLKSISVSVNEIKLVPEERDEKERKEERKKKAFLTCWA